MGSVGREWHGDVEHREALGDALVRLGKDYLNLVVLSPDVTPSTRVTKFKATFPNRFVCTGISEQNTLSMAAGLSTTGWLPVVVGYAMFICGKAWEQVRNSIAYPHLNVKIVGTHAGINVGPDGVTHQATEDIALMRSIPGLIVLAPTDANQVEPVLRLALETVGPVYVRLERAPIPVLTQPDAQVSVGESFLMRAGKDATIVAIGSMVAMGLEAAEVLGLEGIDTRVISMVSIKPLDEAAIIHAAVETGAIVVAEDHSRHGGLGGAIAEALARLAPTPMEQVAVQDTFAESGRVDELRAKYHLTSADIAQAVRKAVARRSAIIGKTFSGNST